MVGFMRDHALEGDERACRKGLPLSEMIAELPREKIDGGDDGVGSTDAAEHQIAKTRPHRIPHHQRPREHGNRRSHSQNHNQICSLVVSKTAANQRGFAHQ